MKNRGQLKNPDYPRANIFMSNEFYHPSKNNKNKIGLVLIQGPGAVRSGIWARSVAINEDFNLGTMLPQVSWA